MKVPLATIRECLEGAMPSSLATCAPDGAPNVTFVSQVHFVDATHVAFSFQFFSKTHENVLHNPRAAAIVIDPTTAYQYRLELEYIRTECSGPLFERMKARLAGIASHSGMSGVFRLLGADVYRVHEFTRLPGAPQPPGPPRPNPLSAPPSPRRSPIRRIWASCWSRRWPAWSCAGASITR